MYLSHFGLTHAPFAITPDPRFLYLSERYREALAHLLYGVGAGGGFVLLTGEVGTGKTTLCRGLLEQLPADVDAALVINPSLGADELIDAIGDELGVARPAAGSGKARVDQLNRHLLAVHASGRRSVLIIDEAQLLGPEALEQVRLLTNLETHTAKLLQVILIGQPELRRLLARPGLRQLAQRITARYHLEPLTRAEVDAYIDHRLRLAGADGSLFEPRAKGCIQRASRGIPRLINSICDRALLGAYAQGSDRVGVRTARRAAAEVLGQVPRGRGRHVWLALPLLAAAGLGGWLYATQLRDLEPAIDLADAPSASRAAPAATPAPLETVSVPVPPPAAPPPATPPAAALAPALHADRGAALASLAQLWDPTAAGIVGACDTLPAAGLACFSGQGSWAALRALDRPAVLTLTAPGVSTRPAYAVAVAVAGDRVELLAADGSRRSVDRDTLLAAWFGRFDLVWQPPGVPLLRRGDRGPAVAWLRARLDDRASARADPLRFDADLEARVLAFQQAHDLTADGLVGQQTMLQLDLLAGPGPRLAHAED
jgi:general secretion pathway protein A